MTGIAIFVKTPGVSAVKTRLAATIGAERATTLYERCAHAVAEAAREASVGAVYWATAEPIERVGKRWSDLPLLDQEDGGLGERMHRVMAELVRRHGSALLLGADAPQLDTAVLVQAARHLTRNPPSRVIGSARDGGFWTFGANHVPDLPRWTRVPYSHPDTLISFMESIGDNAEWLELPMLTDLDTAADMPRVAAELAALRHALPRQKELMELIVESKPA